METFLGNEQRRRGGLPHSLLAPCGDAVAVPRCVQGAGASPLTSLLPFAPGVIVTIGFARSARDIGAAPGNLVPQHRRSGAVAFCSTALKGIVDL